MVERVRRTFAETMGDEFTSLLGRTRSLASASIALAAAGAIGTWWFPDSFPKDFLGPAQVDHKQVLVLELELERSREQLVLARTQLAAAQHGGVQISVARPDAVKTLQSQISAVDQREKALESVILTNPAKALETPLLRRDIDNVKQSDAEATAAIQHSVDRVYDQNKYVMITIAVSIILLALSTFFKSSKKE